MQTMLLFKWLFMLGLDRLKLIFCGHVQLDWKMDSDGVYIVINSCSFLLSGELLMWWTAGIRSLYMAMNPTVLRQQFLQRPMLFVAMDLMARWKCTCDGFFMWNGCNSSWTGIYKHIRFNDSTTDHVMDCVDPQQSGLYRVMDSTTDSMLDVMDWTKNDGGKVFLGSNSRDKTCESFGKWLTHWTFGKSSAMKLRPVERTFWSSSALLLDLALMLITEPYMN